MAEFDDLLKKILASAEMVYASGDYTSATVLYFKLLFGISDLAISRLGLLEPKDHTQRFQILKYRIPELYVRLDRLFPIYTNTYRKSTDRKTCDEVRNEVRALAKEYGIID